MPTWLRWCLGIGIFLMIAIVPFLHYRATYAHGKRLRVVTPGKFYRCGQLTADGFREAIQVYGIKVVLNLQDENPDPLVPDNYYRTAHVTPESEVCRQAGARYVMLTFDLPARHLAHLEEHHPKVIDAFLKLCDDPANLPILLHCKAGLHRTGLLTAIYRIEYEGWTKAEALRELRANGFGDSAATSANDYIYAFLEVYQPRRLREQVKTGKLGKTGQPEAQARKGSP